MRMISPRSAKRCTNFAVSWTNGAPASMLTWAKRARLARSHRAQSLLTSMLAPFTARASMKSCKGLPAAKSFAISFIAASPNSPVSQPVSLNTTTAAAGRSMARPALTPSYFTSGGFLFLAQRAAQDLADVGLRQIGAELDVLRPLVAGELLLAVLEHVLLGKLRVLLHHEHLRHLARMLVGHADRGALEHAGMHRQHLLDLVRVHVEARHQDHVLLAVDDAHEALLVHDADVAGVQEAVAAEDLGGLVGALPVALHHLRPLDADLARLAERHVLVVVVAQHDLGRRHWQADRAVVGLEVERIHRRARAGLGQAVALEQRAAGDLLPAIGHRLLHRHAAAHAQPHLGEIELVEIRVVEEGVEQRVDAGDHVVGMLAQLLDELRD